MTHTTGSLRALDGTSLFTRTWTPDRETRADLVLVHGVNEHSGRHAGLASALMLEGVAVHAFDLRGHGQSEGPRGQIESFDEFVSDLGHVLRSARAEGEGRPLFLMGHSLGGLIASAYVADRGADGLAGLVLSSPALADDAPALLKTLAPVVSRWLPRLHVTPLDLSGLSRDPAIERQYREDPLTITKGIRARLGAEALDAMARVHARPDAFDLPMLLFHGTEDRIVPHAGTERLAAQAASDDVTLKLWPGFYHETMNEPEQDEVVAVVRGWLAARLPG